MPSQASSLQSETQAHFAAGMPINASLKVAAHRPAGPPAARHQRGRRGPQGRGRLDRHLQSLGIALGCIFLPDGPRL